MGKGICMNKSKQMETTLSPSGDQQAADQMDNQTLLLRYKETGDMELKWALVLRYTDLVRTKCWGRAIPRACSSWNPPA